MDILYKVRPALMGGLFPNEIPVSHLESGMQESFASLGKYVINGYFVKGSEYYPKNLDFVIYATDETNNGALAGGLIATREKIDGFEFIYHDKIFVIPGYQGKGTGKGLIKAARRISNGKRILPSALRCDEKVNGFYEELSDISGEKEGYIVHGFGFINKKTQKSLFENAEEIFNYLAEYVAQKPATTLKKVAYYIKDRKIYK